MLEISEKIKKETSSCKKNFACLSDPNYVLCKADVIINDTIMVVKCLENNFCSYKMSFGDHFICHCPVRKEIFKRHRK
ncbi:MAG: hypothetical protein HQK89_18035 [Nitrospirae bacterium]|nr:hypothetical protein [Nitrospirota bacterium]